MNWTKVGLKAVNGSKRVKAPVRLNWTKVGLKESDETGIVVAGNAAFELD